jgi:hypothetical protein
MPFDSLDYTIGAAPGSVTLQLSDEALQALFGKDPPAAAIVISHDCDLAQLPDHEPYVEVIAGHLVEKPDGNYTHAKSARRLHLPVGTDTLDLVATQKAAVPKETLADFEPQHARRLSAAVSATLQQWLALRYRRAAFPDEFDRRLSTTKMAERLITILKRQGEAIAAVFFDVDEGQELQRPAEEPYELVVYLLYSTAAHPDAAARAADDAKATIEAARYFPPIEWGPQCQNGQNGQNEYRQPILAILAHLARITLPLRTFSSSRRLPVSSVA